MTSNISRNETIRQPNVPRQGALRRADPAEVRPEATLEQTSLTGVEATGQDLELLTLRQVAGEQWRMASATVTGSAWIDTRLRTIDVSNAVFGQSRFERLQVDDSKFTGVHLSETRLIDVVFADCQMEMASFRLARTSRVRFERCNLRGADFRNADLAGAAFPRCNLTGADFTQADLTGVDWRLAKLDGVIVTPEQLRGVIVSSDQSLFLCGLLGLVIDDGL